MTYSDMIAQYVNAISRTKRGLRVLIVDDLAIEQIAFLETIGHYLPESAARAVDRFEFENELNQKENGYDLIILEEHVLIDRSDRLYVSLVRKKYPDAKIGLFMARENLYHLQTTPQLSDIDMILTKCSTVEAIAEKLCLTFQEPE